MWLADLKQGFARIDPADPAFVLQSIDETLGGILSFDLAKRPGGRSANILVLVAECPDKCIHPFIVTKNTKSLGTLPPYKLVFISRYPGKYLSGFFWFQLRHGQDG